MEDSVLFRRFADALAGRTIPQDAARELAVRMEEDLGVRDGVLLMSAYGMDAGKAWRFSADPKAHEKEVVALMAPAFDAPKPPVPARHIEAACAALATIAASAPDASQALAIAAYTLWFVGRDLLAGSLMRAALDRDEDIARRHGGGRHQTRYPPRMRQRLVFPPQTLRDLGRPWRRRGKGAGASAGRRPRWRRRIA